ncbi:MAG: class I SAM-dependent rRNA methyltransferase [Terriglobales bacterium]
MSKKSPASHQPSTASTPFLPVVKISPRGDARLKSGHPWVYRSDIAAADDVPPGAVVKVADQRGKFLGTALYSTSSQIAIRMLAKNEAEITDLPALIADRIRAAIAYRQQVVADTDSYRVVFSEADFLPGLIIDRYNDVVSVQILTQAMDAEPVRGAIIQTLLEEPSKTAHVGTAAPGCPAEQSSAVAGIVERVDPRIRDLEQLPPRQSGLLWGTKSSTTIKMNGVRFHYDALEGQKTGAFLDQRENYAATARYAHGEALDVFCYQGGFALHLPPHCASVTGVDSSRPALEMADKNAALNGREIEWIEANAFDLLRDYADAGRRYDTVVLDPPAFAKTKRDLDKARGGYKELNLRALKMLAPGGILVSCSCSFHVSAADLLEVVAAAALDAHKTLRLLETRTQAKDHPILLNVPETGYLKCMIFDVSN